MLCPLFRLRPVPVWIKRPALRALPILVLSLVCACSTQPAPVSTLTPSVAMLPPAPETARAVPAAAIIDRSQLLASGLRIEEHSLVRRPEIEPLEFTSLDGRNEVVLLRTHATQLHQRLRPESYYALCFCSLSAMQGSARLETAYIGEADPSGTARVAVTRDGQVIFSLPNRSPGVTSEFRVLAVYDDHWVLELAQRIEKPDATVYLSGRVFIDGQSVNDQQGYQESFGFQTIAGRPFYFFDRAGKIGVVADGEQVALQYDEVPHYGCCSAGALNPRMARNMIAFFARRGEQWYYVEIGAFDEDR